MADTRKQKQKSLLVGITGAAGAGKSTVCRVLRESGCPVLSADEFARAVTAPGTPVLKDVAALFGPQAVGADGAMDRAFVRAAILKDPSLRKKLEALTHPRIQELSRRASEELFKQGHSLVFYEAPLLFEAGSDRQMDKVICVAAEEERLVERVMKRDGVAREAAAALLAAQMPQSEKIKRSDYVIHNDGDEAALERATLLVLDQIKQLG